MPFWRSGRYWITDNGQIIFYDNKVGIDTDSGDTLVANLTVKRDAAQTEDMVEFWDEAGATMGRVLENAQIEVPGYAEDVKTVVAPGGGTTVIATDDQSIFLFDIRLGDATLTLPDPSTLPVGRKYKAKIINTETNGPLRKLTINSAGGANVDNLTAFLMGQLYESIALHTDGTDWWVWPLTNSLPGNTRTVSSSETLRFSDGLILVDTSGGDVTITMPTFTDMKDNQKICVKKITSDANLVILDGNTKDIDDDATFNMVTWNETICVRATSGQWWIV